MARSSSANIFRSSYRDSFVPKTTTRVNIRELDACKDKIKYTISYSGICPSIIAKEIERRPECFIMISAKNGPNHAATSKQIARVSQVGIS
jgi:aminoglycoside phosphotransferase